MRQPSNRSRTTRTPITAVCAVGIVRALKTRANAGLMFHDTR
jgi:hypothetical protein